MLLSDELLRHETIDNLHMEYATRDRIVQKECIEEIISERYYNTGRTYNLHVQLGVRFKCTPMAYSMAVQDARKTLLRRIYAPLFNDLQEIKRAAHSGDSRDIEKICSRLENELIRGTEK